MKCLIDIHNRSIRLTQEREEHIENDHPEMFGQLNRIQDKLSDPDIIVKSRSEETVELFYKHYTSTPVTEKYLCTAVKVLLNDLFIITAYFTDSIKRGTVLWKKK